MKSTLRAKLLQHFLNKKQEGGFTLIELLVVIIIIGILAAIALPSFLNQANKARQSEATTNLGAINRGQQAYTLENQFFSRSIAGLGLGVRVESDNYLFGDGPDASTATANFVDGVADDGSIGSNQTQSTTNDAAYETGAIAYAAPQSAVNLKGYLGAAYLLSQAETGETTSTTLLCEERGAGTDDQDEPSITAADGLATVFECGADSVAR